MIELMVAITIASIILVGITAGYSALSRATARLAVAQGGLSDRLPPRCRSASPTQRGERLRDRCDLPERCEFDNVSETCRTTTPA